MVRQFAELCGVTLDDWQAYVVDALFSVDETGEWAATEAGLLAARQNGKGEILVAYDLGHLFLFPRRDNRRKTILHSAHEFKTAVDGFDRLRGVIESTPQLMERVEQIYTGAGQQQIVLKRRPGQRSLGDRIKFVARSKSSGRGFSADILVYDEAQELGVTARDALTYTQTTIENRQEFYTGTVPDEAENDFEVFEGVRDRGRSAAEESPRTLWLEWSPPGSEDPDTALLIDPADPANWAWANPAGGIRIRKTTVAEQLDRDTSAKKESFRRERLSIWPARRPEEQRALNDLDMQAWEDTANPSRLRRQHGDLLVLSPCVADSGGYASISGASRLEDGRIFVEHLDTRGGTRWVAGAVADLAEELGSVSVVLDEKKCAPILADLKRHRVRWLSMKPGEIAAAHSLIIEHVNDRMVEHRGQPELTDSLRLAKPRNVGAYGRTWEQSDETEPVTPAQSITQAHWGVKNYEANPPKKGLVRGYA